MNMGSGGATPRLASCMRRSARVPCKLHILFVATYARSTRSVPRARRDRVMRNAGDPNRRILGSSADGRGSERRTWSEHVRVLSGVPQTPHPINRVATYRHI